MRDIAIGDLVELVSSNVRDGESRIEKMFEWHSERDMTITKWAMGAAASLVALVVGALLTAETAPTWWHAALLVLLALGSASYGIYRLRRFRSIHRQFVAALSLYSQLKSIVPVINRGTERTDQ
ncbi:hypothetical protein HQ560_22050 [bacterium]|nr:hypothetical protein [bacterium]